MCNNIKLNIIQTNDHKSNQQTTLSTPSEYVFSIISLLNLWFLSFPRPIDITLRTFLNQEYKCRVTLDKTISELKQIFGKQEKLDPNRITITKSGSYFDQLDDNRTLKSYDCDSTTILMIGIHK
jgi:hypothetical protein